MILCGWVGWWRRCLGRTRWHRAKGSECMTCSWVIRRAGPWRRRARCHRVRETWAWVGGREWWRRGERRRAGSGRWGGGARCRMRRRRRLWRAVGRMGGGAGGGSGGRWARGRRRMRLLGWCFRWGERR